MDGAGDVGDSEGQIEGMRATRVPLGASGPLVACALRGDAGASSSGPAGRQARVADGAVVLGPMATRGLTRSEEVGTGGVAGDEEDVTSVGGGGGEDSGGASGGRPRGIATKEGDVATPQAASGHHGGRSCTTEGRPQYGEGTEDAA